jgi:hypothetical protein
LLLLRFGSVRVFNRFRDFIVRLSAFTLTSAKVVLDYSFYPGHVDFV